MDYLIWVSRQPYKAPNNPKKRTYHSHEEEKTKAQAG